MPLAEAVTNHLQTKIRVHERTRRQRRWLGMRISMGQIQEAPRNQGGLASLIDLTEPNADKGVGLVRRNPHARVDETEHLDVFGQWLRIDRQRKRVLATLVRWPVRIASPTNPVAGVGSRTLVTDDRPRHRLTGSLAESSAVEQQTPWLWHNFRPDRLSNPPPCTLGVVRLWRDGLLHPDAQHRLVHDPCVDALQPVVPPAKTFLKETDRWSRQGILRIEMCPWADQRLTRTRIALEQAWDRIWIAIIPAADHVDRALHRIEILTDGAVLPEGIPTLMTKPFFGIDRCVFESIKPHLAPRVTDDRRVRRPSICCQHR